LHHRYSDILASLLLLAFEKSLDGHSQALVRFALFGDQRRMLTHRAFFGQILRALGWSASGAHGDQTGLKLTRRTDGLVTAGELYCVHSESIATSAAELDWYFLLPGAGGHVSYP